MNLIPFIERLRAWSDRTFGTDRPLQYNVDHIRSELLEIEAEPTDVMEWVDVIILALDGAGRGGHSPERIASALLTKMLVIEGRTYIRRPDGLMTHVKE